MTAAIAASNVVKTFGSVRALDGLDLHVATGDVHGFLGPNGAGKSVTIRILLGLLRADSGTTTVLGADPWNDAVELHRRLAYVPGDVNLWPNLSGGETIDLLGRLRGGIDQQRRADLIDRFDLDPSKKNRTYSKGNRQKVALVAGLASDVELLLLDEPTSGLDPLMESVFEQCIKEVASQGRTVLLSSHILGEVEKLCDHVTIIRSGRTVRDGTLGELRSLARTSITATTERPADDVARIDGTHNVRHDGERLMFDVDRESLDEAIRHLSGFGITSLTSQPPSLEELFLHHYDGTSVAPDAAPDTPER
ncbi:ABC transporter ATP-binding protein [Ilumatobacter coccineus]|uniref:Putative polyketide ABC transporter ATP-binding protein n=1 Tax=Ilumatobacter coccineus (strain NBRC 103263 / KCTC 29153 / YM16-304) TaxID=1313172 RepID=A0A6C7EA96_ILUCY|nr:ABC transporter ATP-binding protein [Ilumatobacter coccineus]BAN02055.1 putative polyketide ABC transporter ATP-binding protein [Ilumatobacter coccineus YM16-304]